MATDTGTGEGQAARAAPQGGAPSGTLARLGELAWQALPAIGSAIGFAGFVAVIGGAIQWIRFWAAGLPADQAVRAIPNQELVSIGAVSVIGFMVIGVFAVLVVYALDRQGDVTVLTVRGLVALAVVEMASTLVYVRIPWWGYVLIVIWLLITAGFAWLVLAPVPVRLRTRDERIETGDELRQARRVWEESRDQLDDATFLRRAEDPEAEAPTPEMEHARARHALALHRWQRVFGRWRAQSSLADDLGPQLDRVWRNHPPSELELEAALPSAKARAAVDRDWSRLRQAVVLALGIALGATLLVLFHSTRWLVIMLGVVVLLALANLVAARATRKFAWYGFAVFISVILFGAALSIVRTIRVPKVQPVALIRKSDNVALCGVYITETDKRVYVGRVQPSGDGAKLGVGRIFWVPVTDVDVVSVGPLQHIKDAALRAQALRAELYVDRAQQAAPVMKPTTTTRVVGPNDTDPRVQVTTATEKPAKVGQPRTRPSGIKVQAQSCARDLP